LIGGELHLQRFDAAVDDRRRGDGADGFGGGRGNQFDGLGFALGIQGLGLPSPNAPSRIADHVGRTFPAAQPIGGADENSKWMAQLVTNGTAVANCGRHRLCGWAQVQWPHPPAARRRTVA
jgi:hypothetical protein